MKLSVNLVEKYFDQISEGSYRSEMLGIDLSIYSDQSQLVRIAKERGNCLLLLLTMETISLSVGSLAITSLAKFAHCNG